MGFLNSILLLSTALILSSGLYGHAQQNQGKSNINLDDLESPKLARIYKKANKSFSYGDFYAALPDFATLVMEKPENPEFNYKFGLCLLYASYTKKEAIDHLKVAYQQGYSKALLYLGQAYHLDYQFDEAIKTYKLYQLKTKHDSKEYLASDVNKLIEKSVVAKELISKPVDVVIENMGPNINSPYPDYVPLISADDQELFFTSRREGTTGGKIDHNKYYYEDIYSSVRDSAGMWQKCEHLSERINTNIHDAAAGLSADGHTLLIYRNDTLEGGGDLYITYDSDSSWTKPVKMDEVINRKGAWQPSASFTANETEIYFTSNRPGGYGGRDIYHAKRLPTGHWSEPINVGPVINTKYDEDGPFIHPDGKTLYFSSRGHKNMGGFDIFKSEKLDSNKWTTPENLGYPISTVDDDIYFVVTASGEMGYYSSLKEDGFGEKDIYAIHMNLSDKALAVLKGKITNKENVPLASTISIFPLGSKQLSGLYTSNASSGRYLSILLPGKIYKVVFASEGYTPDTLLVNCEQVNSYHEIVRNVKLYKPGEPFDTNAYDNNKSIVLSKKQLSIKQQSSSKSIDSLVVTIKSSLVNDPDRLVSHNDHVETGNNGNTVIIYFDYNGWQLVADHTKVLDSLVNTFSNKGVRFKLHAHADAKGSDKYNYTLTQKRANATLKYLLDKGFYNYNMEAIAYGEKKPLAPNQLAGGKDNPAGRAKNRRVEIEFSTNPNAKFFKKD